MIKVYKSTSVISFPITFADGAYTRIKFTPYSFGGGVYSTSNPKIIDALEKHPSYGTSFVCISGINEEEKVEEEVQVEIKKVEVSDIDEAKEYLVEKCGCKGQYIRSVASIKKAASQCNIEFVGI